MAFSVEITKASLLVFIIIWPTLGLRLFAGTNLSGFWNSAFSGYSFSK